LTAVARAARQVIADHLKSDAEQEQEEREKDDSSDGGL
jgi:DNA-binding FrmR family transcriptional regulator